MKKLLLNTSVLTLFFGLNSLIAQETKFCGSDEATLKLFKTHPELLNQAIEHEKAYKNATLSDSKQKTQDNTVYIIPVVFHVLHQNGPENISDAQIIDAMNILNRDFRKLNPDTIDVIPRFKSLVADIKIEFKLAQLDPQGNCTNGIDRIYTSKTNYADDSAKLNPWPRDKYLNIWTAKALLLGAGGFAYLPSSSTGSLAVHDGIVIAAQQVGSIGTSNPISGRALTHEVGHWLDLPHPWTQYQYMKFDVGLACGNDLIDDTPITRGHTSSTCPSNLLTPDCQIDDFSPGTFDFNSVTTSSGNSDPSLTDSDFDSLNVIPFQAIGVSANSDLNNSFSFSDWPLGALDGETNYTNLNGTINTSKYYELTISPKSFSSMKLSGLTFNVNRSATGPRTYAIRSSADGFSSNLTATLLPSNPNLSLNTGNVFFFNNDATLPESGSKISVSGSAFTDIVNPITFRIYAWNAEDALGSFTIDDVSILGSTGVIENYQNYMDYTYRFRMFTTGQKDRMRAAVTSTIADRSNLWSTNNLAATGVTLPTTTCVPYPDFYTTRTRICKGNSLTFTKNILNGTETSRLWTFQGGTPASSTASNPTVTYNTPGTYAVSLSVTNAAGSNTVTKTQYIRVDNNTADIFYSGSYSEGFETPTILDSTWQSYDYDNNNHKWAFASNAGISGSNAVEMNAYKNYDQDIDELMSPSFDLTNAVNKSFNFKVAAASVSNIDSVKKGELRVFFSTNCGLSWTQRAVYTDSTLINNSATTSAFMTNSSTIWSQKSITISPAFQTSNLRVKFQYKSTWASNNLYIDNVNISETVGIEENELNNSSFAIYPNPSNETSTISYHLNSNATTRLQVFDVLGKCIYQILPGNQTAGDYTITLSKQGQNISNGLYFVKLTVNNKAQTQKLIISE